MAQLRIEAPASARTGESFIVQILASELVNAGAYEFALVYDPKTLWLRSAEHGSALASGERTVGRLGPIADNEKGRLEIGGYSYGAQDGNSGDGLLARVAFLTLGPGGSRLGLEGAIVTDVNGAPAAVTVAGASIATEGDRIEPPRPRRRIFMPTVQR